MADKVWEDSSNERKVNCRCIANINGICKARECKGEIRRLTDCETNPDEAARRYDMSKKSFEDYFSGDYKDTDTEE